MAPPGKKIGPITVTFGSVSKTFDLRFDIKAGRFHVQLDDRLYSSDTKADLAKQLEDVVRLDASVQWSKYIVVDYSSHTAKESRHHDERELDERAPGRVRSIKLEWRVAEFSNPHQRSGDEGCLVILEREVGGSVCDTHRGAYNNDRDRTGKRKGKMYDDPHLPKFSIPWSEERERSLITIREALTSVDRKLREFLGADVDHLAAALQTGLGNVLALPAPPPLPHAEDCDSLRTECTCGAEDRHGEAVLDEDDDPIPHEDDCAKIKRMDCDCDAGG